MSELDEALAAALAAEAAQPDSADAFARAGAILAVMGRPADAAPHLDRALALRPSFPEALNNRGAVLRALNRLPEARESFAAALAAAPDYTDARYNLAGTLVKLERYAEALPHYELLLAVRPSSARISTEYGKLLWKTGRTEPALAALARAIELDPSYHEAHAQLADSLTEAGRIDEAAVSLGRAIELAPDHTLYYRLLAVTKLSAVTAAHVDALETILAGESPSDDDRVDANFALGAVRSAAGDRERSFAHYVRANSTRRKYIDYHEADALQSFDRIAETFTRDFFEARRACSVGSDRPIFVFGMPRSGTTLIEQILASHPDVFPCGELDDLEQIVNDIIGNGSSVAPNAMLSAGCESLREIARQYVAALDTLAPLAFARVTDKMPGNVRFAGLIHTILPNARMIHARRNPLDNCASIFSINFSGDLPWAYELSELGRYYRAYDRLAAHWRAVLPPESMIEVQYEDVVADLEAQARRIVAFCGLQWEPACLEFYKTERVVRTASVTQVRKPLYKTSVNRAATYGDLLKPLIDALGK